MVAARTPVMAAGITSLLNEQEHFDAVDVSGAAPRLLDLMSGRKTDIVLVEAALGAVIHQLLRVRSGGGLSGVAVVALVVGDTPVGEILPFLARSGVDGVVSLGDHPLQFVAAVDAVRGGSRWVSPTLGARLLENVVGGVPESGGVGTTGARLTPSERSVLGMVADGYTDRQIATRIRRSERTVKYHVANLMAKFQASNRAHVVTLSIRAGVLPVAFPNGQGSTRSNDTGPGAV